LFAFTRPGTFVFLPDPEAELDFMHWPRGILFHQILIFFLFLLIKILFTLFLFLGSGLLAFWLSDGLVEA